jgi:uncharacterized membrane protein
MRLVHFAYIAALSAAVVWCALLFAAPICVSAGGSWGAAGETIYSGFHRICHQLDARSLHVHGLPLAACSRCSAIYLAFLAGMVVYPILKPLNVAATPSRTTLVLALVPMLIDVALAMLDISESTTVTRIVTGAWFGLMLPFVVLPVYLGAVLEQQHHYHNQHSLK